MSWADSVLAFITSYTAEHGYPPTVRQIRAGTGMSSSSMVHYYLVKLEEEGLIEREWRSPRAIRLLSPARTHVSEAEQLA